MLRIRRSHRGGAGQSSSCAASSTILVVVARRRAAARGAPGALFCVLAAHGCTCRPPCLPVAQPHGVSPCGTSAPRSARPSKGGGDQRAQPGAQPPLARAAACLARENGLRAAGTHCPASIRARDFAQGRRCAPIASRRHRCGTHNGNRFAFCARREAKRRSVLGPTNDAPGPRSVGCHHVRDHGRLLLPTINRSFLLCSRTSPDRAAMKCLPRGLNMSASKKRRKEKEKNHRVPPPSASALSAVCSASVFRLVFQFDFESSQFHHRAAQRGEG